MQSIQSLLDTHSMYEGAAVLRKFEDVRSNKEGRVTFQPTEPRQNDPGSYPRDAVSADFHARILWMAGRGETEKVTGVVGIDC